MFVFRAFEGGLVKLFVLEGLLAFYLVGVALCHETRFWAVGGGGGAEDLDPDEGEEVVFAPKEVWIVLAYVEFWLEFFDVCLQKPPILKIQRHLLHLIPKEYPRSSRMQIILRLHISNRHTIMHDQNNKHQKTDNRRTTPHTENPIAGFLLVPALFLRYLVVYL